MRNQIASEFRKLATTWSIYAMLAGLIVIVGLGGWRPPPTRSRAVCSPCSSTRCS